MKKSVEYCSQCTRTRFSDEFQRSVIHLAASLEAEETRLKNRMTELQASLAQQSRQSKSAKEFADLIEQYAPVKELDETLLNTLSVDCLRLNAHFEQLPRFVAVVLP